MIKKASLLVLTGAITISSLGLTTTSFADVREENLLVQEMNAKSKNQVVTEQDGTVRVAGEDGQLGTADDVLVKPGLNGQAPQIDQFGNVTLPTGGRVIFANGTIVTDHVNEHSIITPGGSVVTPNDKGDKPIIDANGNVKHYTYEKDATKFDGGKGTSSSVQSVTIINRKGFDLPVTGGFGTLLFSGIGALLVVGGIGVLMSIKKKKGNA